MFTKRSTFGILSLFIALVLTFSTLGVTPADAIAGIVVNSSADAIADDGLCTLREAITNANGDSQLYATAGECSAGSGADTISFAADYTITLVGSQLPAVTTAITINGNGEANTIIEANAAPNTATYRVVEVGAAGNLTLNSLTVRNGRCNGSCATNSMAGGGIYNAGTLTVSNVTFSANSAANYGGGMYNTNSNAMLTNVTFSSNSGGGMYNTNSSATLTNVTFSANSSYSGGGMGNYLSNPTLTNVTFNANSSYSSASGGGGMFNYASSPTLTNVTFNANSAANYGFGGGIYNDNSSPTLTNVIIANSVNGGDCYNVTSTLNAASSNNLIEDAANACGLTNAVNGNIIGSDPMLGTLANNGGFTQTHALMAGSPAINTGANTGCPATDQRGATRPQGAQCDIGAYEYRDPIFFDVPLAYWANVSIERLYIAGITSGCSVVPLNYCPTTPVTRAQMAIFLLRGMHGSTYTPPAATGTKFNDVPLGTFGAAWIEQLAVEGITSGCGGGNYCPTTPVSRAQMAIFLVRAKHGIAFIPPTATGIFADVPVGSFGADYIEQLSADAITSGCGVGTFCPNTTVKRDSMAVFLVKIFNLP